MTLDPDLLREVLISLASAPPNTTPQIPEIAGHSQDEIFEHVQLLHDAGFIEARILPSSVSQQRIYAVHVIRVKYAGHAFLAAARDEAMWKVTKKTFRDKGVEFTLDLASRILSNLAASHMGLPPT
jgi:hypothetical protein